MPTPLSPQFIVAAEGVPAKADNADRIICLLVFDRPDPEGPDTNAGLAAMGDRIMADICETYGTTRDQIHMVTQVIDVETTATDPVLQSGTDVPTGDELPDEG